MNVVKCQSNYSNNSIGYKRQNSVAFGAKIGDVPLDEMEKCGSEVMDAVKGALNALRSEYGDDVTVSFGIGKTLIRRAAKLITNVEQHFGELRLPSCQMEDHTANKEFTLKGKKISTEQILSGVQDTVQKLSKYGDAFEQRKKVLQSRSDLQRELGLEEQNVIQDEH